jgi:hypothetical protein
VLKNNSFELASNSGEKDEGWADFLQNLSSMKFRKRSRYLLQDFNDIESMQPSKQYSYFNMPSRNEAYDVLAKVKQNQAAGDSIKCIFRDKFASHASKNIIK